jgi:hypothetical protein
MQWGPSYAPGGWHAFVMLLANGIKIQVTATNPSTNYLQNSMTSFSFPEVWPVVNDVYLSNPWVSRLSNITYYSNYRIDILPKGTSLDVTLPVQGSETA